MKFKILVSVGLLLANIALACPQHGNSGGGGKCGNGGNCGGSEGRGCQRDCKCSDGKCDKCKGDCKHECSLHACMSSVATGAASGCAALATTAKPVCRGPARNGCYGAACVIGGVLGAWKGGAHEPGCCLDHMSDGAKCVVKAPEIPLCDTALTFHFNGEYRAYFFLGNQYVRHTAGGNPVDSGYPAKVEDYWKGLWTSGVQAALQWPTNDRLYFFHGDEYTRFHVRNDEADWGYPKKIRDEWKGLWERDIDAAFISPAVWDERYGWDSKKAFFFKGDEYMRYDINREEVDSGFPKKITRTFPGLWQDGNLKAAIVEEATGKIYFLRSYDYLVYDIDTEKPVEGPITWQ